MQSVSESAQDLIENAFSPAEKEEIMGKLTFSLRKAMRVKEKVRELLA